jgi:hypothetical protein
VLGVLVGILVALLPWEAFFVWLVGRFDLAHARHEEQKSLSPQVALAYRLRLTYDQVVADPQAYTGQPVVWCVDHPDVGGQAYLEGRLSRPLIFSNAAALPSTGYRGGHCVRMLAVVESSGSLRYVGTP